MKKLIRNLLRKLNYDIVKVTHKQIPSDFDELHKNIYAQVADYTMTSPERIYSLIEAVRYVEKNKIEGDVVECGVWKGGSMIAVAETLKFCNSYKRELYLYDTYEGMSAPTEHDKTFYGKDAESLLKENTNKESNRVWAYSTLEDVKLAIKKTSYPEDKIKFIKGKVEETIPGTIPLKIAILRLDTDWYESTRHELIHLFPLLTKGGVLILDDYGHWQGARKAVDEYFQNHITPILLNRIDETGRIAIKQS
jgi:hypothetical protein